MAVNKKSLSNLRPAQKGDVRNPEGARARSPELKELRNLTEEELVEVGSLVVKGSLEELQAMAKDKKNSVLKCMVAAVAAKTIQKGDPHALDVLLNRLIGKVKEKVEVSGNSGGPQITITLPSNGREINIPASAPEIIQEKKETNGD